MRSTLLAAFLGATALATPSFAQVAIPPSGSIQNAINANPVGTVFQLQCGTYSNQSMLAKNNDQFLGDPSGCTIIDGGGTQGGLTWDNGATGVLVQDVTLQHFKNSASTGVIHGVRNWRIIRVTAQLNASVGVAIAAGTVVQGGKYVDNGQTGIDGYKADGAVVDSVEIARNNTARAFDSNNEAGGLKMANGSNVTLSNDYVHDNGGPGLWGDVDCAGWTVINNTVANNKGNGIMYEISHGPTNGQGAITKIDNNKISGNTSAGIYISNSDGVEASGNTVTVPSGNAAINAGIDIINDKRGSGPFGVWQSVNVTVQGNTIIHSGDGAQDGLFVYQALPANPNITFNKNTYYVPNANGTYWHFVTTDYNWTSLRQSTPYEANGTLHTGLPGTPTTTDPKTLAATLKSQLNAAQTTITQLQGALP